MKSEGATDRAPTLPRVVLPLGLAIILSLAGDQAMYATLATQTEVVGISVAAVGMMLGINRLVRIPTNPLGGMLIDRLGRRRPFILGMAFGVASTASYAFARGFWPLLAARGLWGLAWVLINVSGMAMMMDVTVPANRGRVSGLYQIAYLLGLGLAASFGGIVVDMLGFQRAMLVCAGITSVGMLVALIALPETARKRQGAPAPARQQMHRKVVPGTPKGARDLAPAVAKLARSLDPRFLAVTAMFTATRFARSGVVMSTVTLLLLSRFGDSLLVGGKVIGVASLGGTLLGLGPLLGIVSGPLAGHLSDGERGRWRIVNAGFILGILGFGLLAVTNGLWAIVAGVLLVSLADGALLATLMAQAGDLVPRGRKGISMGLYAAGGDLGSAAGPLLAYALVQLLDLRWIYLGCGGLFLLTLGIAWHLNRGPGLDGERVLAAEDPGR